MHSLIIDSLQHICIYTLQIVTYVLCMNYA